ncbi:hypothetical protein EEB11_07485 [Pseudotabrizicola sediminis]|uniref:Glycosyl transferase family 1 n=1 Tax=Pseudotabrizicola sediminis TaxID=2486418 RepID=A0ABY2KMN7_9RHOB|nr:hypothetical protein [Pseudotabrizicola sediminis]TGD43819.1 hypothetical protein EEB11_07485 [Pseudotabrizicola sediminis]
MPFALPHPDDRPVRILFVFAWLAGGEEEAEIRLLAQSLDPARFRIDALPCARSATVHDPAFRSLRNTGVNVDDTALDYAFADTVTYLAKKITGYEIIISCQDVADIYPALDRLQHHPPLIERGRSVPEAMVGPKHLTTRYVGASEDVRTAAADRMPGRAQHARTIPLPEMSAQRCRRLWNWLRTRLGIAPAVPPSDPVLPLWQSLFDEVLAETAAPPPRLFRSFVQGGFECASQRLQTGRRLDVIAATRHDTHAGGDYSQLAQMGLRTVRDGARWHLIERQPGVYDFSSFLPMAHAANQAGTQVLWDLLHYGWPDDIDIWHPEFVIRFAGFARAIAQALRTVSDEVPFWCPVNEISFFAWAGGDVRYLNPFATGRGMELKVQLARASIAAMHALRDVDPRARFVHCEPLIAIHPDPGADLPRSVAERLDQAQFEAFDLLSGQIWPQIGGDPSLLDIIGVNYYPRNQWLHGGPGTGTGIDVDHPTYRPLSDLLFATYARYHRPLFIAETGVEDNRRAPWLRYVAGEVSRARARGVPVDGLCLYPVMNHPGWDDDRACQNGLLTQQFIGGQRGVDAPLSVAVAKAVTDFALPR